MDSLHSCVNFVIFVPILHMMEFMVNYEQVWSARGVGTEIEESIEDYEEKIQDSKKIKRECI